MHINDYKEIIVEEADRKSNSILPSKNSEKAFKNTSETKASIVMANIFRTSDKSANMYVNNFENTICLDKNCEKQLKDALERGVKVSVVFDEKPNVHSSTYNLVEKLINKYPEGFIVDFISETAKSNLKERKINHGRPFHFVVADERMYSFECDVKEHNAYFSFNDKDRAKRIENLFEIASGVSDKENLKENSKALFSKDEVSDLNVVSFVDKLQKTTLNPSVIEIPRNDAIDFLKGVKAEELYTKMPVYNPSNIPGLRRFHNFDKFQGTKELKELSIFVDPDMVMKAVNAIYTLTDLKLKAQSHNISTQKLEAKITFFGEDAVKLLSRRLQSIGVNITHKEAEIKKGQEIGTEPQRTV